MKWISAGLVLLGLWSADVYACSPVPGYRIPTNIELLESADLVVLARVRQGLPTCRKVGESQYCQGSVRLFPERVLKGNAVADLRVEGYLSDRQGGPNQPQFTPLDRSHDSAWWGACIRQAYTKNALVLALFRERDGRMVQFGEPFARAIEDVAGADALWVRAAQLYLQILGEAPPADRRRAFAQERDRLRAMADDADAQAIAADIDTYLTVTAGDRLPETTLPSTP